MFTRHFKCIKKALFSLFSLFSIPTTALTCLLASSGQLGGDRQDHAGGGEAAEGRLPAAERLQPLRQILPLLQDRGHAQEHRRLLRPLQTRRRDHGTVRQQGH